MWRDRRAVAGAFEDVYVLLVVTVGVAVFLTSLVASYSGYVAQTVRIEGQRAAWDLLDALLEYEPILHEGRRGLFDGHRLGALSLSNLSRDLALPAAFRLVAVDPLGDYRWTLEAGDLEEPLIGTTTSANLWIHDRDVRPLRVTVILGGS